MQCGLDDAWGRQRLSGYGGSWVCIGVLGVGNCKGIVCYCDTEVYGIREGQRNVREKCFRR